MFQKFILVNNKLTCGKDLYMYAVPRVSSSLATLESFLSVTKHFLGSCVLRVGEQGGQGLQRKTQGTGTEKTTL